MATNKELQQQVTALEKRIKQLSATNSRLLDEVTLLKTNYTTLVTEVSARFEAVQKRFQG
jgi:cell division protein FtsB|tara:strand:- start:1993 stop:2172 length:180 start_codon:yes stop_codon:yes gene_type:complete